MVYLCSSKKAEKEERLGLTRVPQLSRRPKSWVLYLMGRYTNYYGEEERLPEGMVCTGYDAGTGRRYYRDMKDGSVWVGAPHVEYDLMNSVLDTSKTSPKEDNLRYQRKIFHEESEDETSVRRIIHRLFKWENTKENSKKAEKEERLGLTRVPQLSRRPKSWVLYLMGRYTNYYGEEERLPEGMVCTGYDAGTGRRYYRDMKDGSVWVGAPHVEYDLMNSVLDTSKTSPKEDNLRYQRKIFHEESEDEKEAIERNPGSRAATKSNSAPTTVTSRESQRNSTGVSSDTATLVAPDVPFSASQDDEARLITAIGSTASLNLPTSPAKSTASRIKRREKRSNSEPLSPISVATSLSTYSQPSQWSKSDYQPNTSEVQLRSLETASREESEQQKLTGVVVPREGASETSILSPISVATTPSVYSQQSDFSASEKRSDRDGGDSWGRVDDRNEPSFDAASSPGSTPTIAARKGDLEVEAGSKFAQRESSETQYRSSFSSSSSNTSPTRTLSPEHETSSTIPFPSSSSYQDFSTRYTRTTSRPVSSASATTTSTVTPTPVTARTSVSMSSTATMFASPHSETSPLLLQFDRSPRGLFSDLPVPHTPPGLGPLSPRSISIYPETPSALGHELTMEDINAHERLFESSASGIPLLVSSKPSQDSPLISLQSPALLEVTGLDGLPSPPGPAPGSMSMHILFPSQQLRSLGSQRRVEIEENSVNVLHQTPEHILETSMPHIGGSNLAKSPSGNVVEGAGKLEQAVDEFPGFSLTFESGPELSLGFEVDQKESSRAISNGWGEPVIELPSRPEPTQPSSLSRRESMSTDVARRASGEHVRIDTTGSAAGRSNRINIGTQPEKKADLPKRKSMFRRVSDLLGKGK